MIPPVVFINSIGVSQMVSIEAHGELRMLRSKGSGREGQENRSSSGFSGHCA